MPFKEGWLITLRAVSMLIEDFFEQDEISFVLTRRLNQDAVEVSNFRLFNPLILSYLFVT